MTYRVGLAIALLAILLIGMGVTAQTPTQQPSTTQDTMRNMDTARADTSRGMQRGMGMSQGRMGAMMSDSNMMNMAQEMHGKCTQMDTAWQHIYKHFHEMLEIKDQAKLKTEMETHHQMLNAFNQQVAELREMSEKMVGPGGMMGKRQHGMKRDTSGMMKGRDTTAHPPADTAR